MKSKNLPFLFLILALIAFTVFIFQPGYIDNDSANQLEQIRSGHFDDWHPPAMSWLWGQFDRILPGPLSLFLLQVVLFWSGMGIIVNLIASNPISKSLYLLFGLFPPAFMFLGAVIKDILMAAVFLFGIALILYAERRKSMGAFAAGMVFLGYGMLIRHNAILAALPLFLYAGYVLTQIRPEILSKTPPVWRAIGLGASLFLIVFATGRIWNSRLTDTKTYPFQQIMLHDLAGISIRLNTYLIPEYVAASEQPSMKDLRQIYQLRSMKNLYWPDFTNIHYRILHEPDLVDDLFNTWVTEVMDHPRAYLMHRSDVFMGVLGFRGGRHCSPYYYEGTVYKPKGYYQSDGNYYSDNPVADVIYTWMEPLRNSFLYWNWLYLFLPLMLFAASLLMVLRSSVEKRYPAVIALVCSASGILYGAAYFFVATACDFRLFYWNVIASLLAGMFLLCAVLWKNKSPKIDQSDAVKETV